MRAKLSFSEHRSFLRAVFFVMAIGLAMTGIAYGQGAAKRGNENDADFGPVMRAYLGYLRNEQEVVDDRVSRREITAAYYRRNSNRIRALRQMAIRLVQTSENDYVPELEAVAPDELKTLFETPPRIDSSQINKVLNNKFRFLGIVHSGEPFYLFARLDPYEQAELMQKDQGDNSRPSSVERKGTATPTGQRVGQTPTRPRRAIPR